MKKVLLAVALAVPLALTLTGTATAQTQQYLTEVCVNASDAAQAKVRFPNASFHVIPDSHDPAMNGWRLVVGPLRSGGTIMSDAEEIKMRQLERSRDRLSLGE